MSRGRSVSSQHSPKCPHPRLWKRSTPSLFWGLRHEPLKRRRRQTREREAVLCDLTRCGTRELRRSCLVASHTSLERSGFAPRLDFRNFSCEFHPRTRQRVGEQRFKGTHVFFFPFSLFYYAARSVASASAALSEACPQRKQRYSRSSLLPSKSTRTCAAIESVLETPLKNCARSFELSSVSQHQHPTASKVTLKIEGNPAVARWRVAVAFSFAKLEYRKVASVHSLSDLATMETVLRFVSSPIWSRWRVFYGSFQVSELFTMGRSVLDRF